MFGTWHKYLCLILVNLSVCAYDLMLSPWPQIGPDVDVFSWRSLRDNDYTYLLNSQY